MDPPPRPRTAGALLQRVPVSPLLAALAAACIAAALAAGAWAALARAVPAVAAVRGTNAREVGIVVLVVALLVPALRALRPRRLVRWVEPATPEALGAMRCWIATILLASTLWEDLASSAYLPRGMLTQDPQWLVGVLLQLPGGPALFASPGALAVVQGAVVLLLALAALGLGTRWSVPAGAAGYLLMAATLRSYAWSYHTGVIPLLALLALSLTPCGDAISLDRWRRQRRGLPVPAARVATVEHGIGRLLVWMAVAVPYVLAGLSKLRNTGPAWWSSDHMKQMVVSTIAEPMHFDFGLGFALLRAPDAVWGVLAFASVAAELAFGLVLVSRLARRVLPPLMAGMHVGILFTQNILFPDLIAIQAIFFDWRPVLRRAARALGIGGGAAASVAVEGPDAPTRPARVPPRLAVAPAALLAVLAVVWLTRTERFPLTAMQMFSRPAPIGPVPYVRAWSCLESGAVEPARFERWIGAVADSRYRWLLRGWERHPERVRLLHEFLQAAGERANARAAPGERVRTFLVERRSWDFRRDPSDPAHGRLVQVVRHDLAPPPVGLACRVPGAG